MSEILSAANPGIANGPENHPLWRSKNRLKLGTFSWNLEGGNTPTFAEGEGRIGKLNWEQQVRIAQLTEAAGMDVIVPVARWKGFGSASHHWGESYETLVWAAALACSTSKVSIFSTFMVPTLHPIRAAKTAVTIDHISGGRFGLNIVAGWNEAEFAMFGHEQRKHDERYADAEEWTAFVKKLFAEDKPFDWNGKYYQSKGAISEPHPINGRPLLMSAGSSKAGRAFATKNADIIFIAAPQDIEMTREMIQDIKAEAREQGREVQVWLNAGIICCQTEAEALDYYRYFVKEKGDYETAELMAKAIIGGDVQSGDVTKRNDMLEGIIAWAFAYQIFGTPQQVVEKMAALSDAGLDGMVMCWVDYEQGIRDFDQYIRPLAQQAGLMA